MLMPLLLKWQSPIKPQSGNTAVMNEQTPNDRKDKIYTSPLETVSTFSFDKEVAAVFQDMIHRSVPGYAMILEMIGIISQSYTQANTQCYDLGCSLGASTLAIRHSLPHQDCKIIAVDNSPAMIDKCRATIDADKAPTPVELRCADILDIAINNASLVTLNFTLQFIATEQRLSLLKNIAAGLVPGGVLILSEKTALADARGQEILTDLHHAFKRNQGYSDLEIAQKRTALENILVPDTLKSHTERLHQAGFACVQQWFQCFNFISLIAIK